MTQISRMLCYLWQYQSKSLNHVSLILKSHKSSSGFWVNIRVWERSYKSRALSKKCANFCDLSHSRECYCALLKLLFSPLLTMHGSWICWTSFFKRGEGHTGCTMPTDRSFAIATRGIYRSSNGSLGVTFRQFTDGEKLWLPIEKNLTFYIKCQLWNVTDVLAIIRPVKLYCVQCLSFDKER